MASLHRAVKATCVPAHQLAVWVGLYFRLCVFVWPGDGGVTAPPDVSTRLK